LIFAGTPIYLASPASTPSQHNSFRATTGGGGKKKQNSPKAFRARDLSQRGEWKEDREWHQKDQAIRVSLSV
jgi:hypothetical protein